MWNTAAKYHLVHSVLLFVLASFGRATHKPVILSSLVLLGGIVVFSGSLYVLVLSGEGWLGAITPLGGVALIVGWVLAGRDVARTR